jgi:hypothetical protein
MDNYIIYRKVLELEKNKEAALRIPIIFNPSKSEFVIEINELATEQHPIIEFCFKDPRSSIDTDPITIKRELTALVTKFNPTLELGLALKDLLFFAVRSNSAFKVAVSIREVG